MLKDARRYKSTDGWGWGRWRGDDEAKDERYAAARQRQWHDSAVRPYIQTLPNPTATRQPTV